MLWHSFGVWVRQLGNPGWWQPRKASYLTFPLHFQQPSSSVPDALSQNLADFTVWIILHFAVDVEYHDCPTVDIVSRPLRQLVRIRIAGSCKSNPRRTHEIGDTLRLVNRDVRSHAIGPFLVGPGQRVDSRLARAGTYSGACTLHADGRTVSIVVRER